MDVSKFIKKIRNKNNQTQKEFADKYNVSFQAVSKWETGKSIPDITILKKMCEDNNVSLDEVMGGKKKKNYLIFIILIILIILGFGLWYMHDDNFEFKTVSTTCKNFNITGSVAYNKDKSSIYISNIEFCGDNESEIYDKISYVFYEGKNKISSGKVEKNISLKNYLKNLQITINDYKQVCDYLEKSKLYIKIKALKNEKEISYKIPISLEDC